MKTKFILASNSPRRREILCNVGADFVVHASDVDESVPSGTLPFDAVKMISARKAKAVKVELGKEADGKIILSADTVVSADGKILGKPKNDEEAVEMLKFLSGRCHKVYTGFTIIKDDAEYTDFESTDVFFKNLSEKEILSYVKTGEGADKAGSYGIQGIGELLVEKINGDYFNVVGFPISKINVTLFEKFGINLLYFE